MAPKRKHRPKRRLMLDYTRQLVPFREVDVMQALWHYKSATLAEVVAFVYPDMAMTGGMGDGRRSNATQAMLKRLMVRQLVARSGTRMAYLYSPRVSREELLQQQVAFLRNQYHRGDPLTYQDLPKL